MESQDSFKHLNHKCASGEHSTQLLQAQAHIWNHLFSFIKSITLKSAIQLVRLLCTKKLSETDEEIGYILTDASQLLLKDHPFSITPFLMAMLNPILTKSCHYLSTWFQNDDPTPFHTAHGMTCWHYTSQEPTLANLFNDAMASDTRLVTSVVIKECKGVFEGLESLVDVGGNSSCRCNFIEVDIHDWSDKESVKILKRCKEAITNNDKKGKVIIIDMVIENLKEDEESIETQLFFDMWMMMLVTGKERSEKEWGQLFFDAGFSDYKITPILGVRSLIEIFL
ncbi:hypothetical protein M0R45_031111 [Rubus argutus]|uniref:O-methyltransferase C-terminal domain-containing protein n=1 Tax=Rubus argutus TaxID=59490 RepID=A0AAW1WFH1_RUBAR